MTNFQSAPKFASLKRWFSNWSLLNSIGSKLFFCVLFGALVGLGGMSYFFYQVLEEQAKNEIFGTLKLQVKSIDGQLKRIEESMISLSSAVSSMKQSSIKDAKIYKNLAFNFFQQRPPLVMGNGFGQVPFQIITDLKGFWPYFYIYQGEIGAVGEKLSVSNIRYSDLFTDDNYFEQNYYLEPVAKKEILWSEPYDWYGITMMSCLNPFFDDNHKMIGVTGADVNVTALNEQFHQSVFKAAGYFAILSQQGNLLSYPPDANKTKLRTSYKQVPLFNTIWQSMQTTESGVLKIDNVFLAYQRIPSTQWLMLAVVPQSVVLGTVFAITIMGSLGAGIVLALVVILFIRRLNQRLQPILHECQALGDKETQSIDYRGIDELGVLEQSFNRMTTQLKISFETLATKNTELQRSDKLKDEFLANTSHELRTPLNGIIGIAESLIDGATGGLSNKTNANLAMIVGSGKRLANLVNDILDFSKLKHQKLELQLKPIGLREIVEIVITLSKPLISNKPLQLINSISLDLPAAHADENRLQQILHNLIGNAIKFTEKGQIIISAKVVNQSFEVIISDTGIGIEESKFSRIFESFEQAEGSTTRNYGGTGLGLAVTKQLVQLHNGKIWVESKIGIGSQFIFTLPIAKSSAKPLESKDNKLLVEQPIDIVMPVKNDGLFTILIVDDEPVNIQVLINHLSLHNYNIIQASSGIEACKLIKEGTKPDLILLDVMMPLMTGYEAVQEIRKLFPANELPILMLTAKNRISDLVTGLEAGANDYLTKPIDKNELLARVKTHLKLHHLNTAYSRFVPHEFLKFLNKESIIDIQLGDHIEKNMTILFSDIRNFTSLSEQMTPQENFKFINSYLGRMEPIIRQHKGFIDKYIGDAIMALFPTNADEAVQAAIKMLEKLTAYNQKRQEYGLNSIAIGIGLNTGLLMLGTVGGKQRMDGTVISDAVNLASRIEGMTKMYNTALLISEQTYVSLNDASKYAIRTIDRVKVKGRSKPITVYEVFDGDETQLFDLKLETLDNFEKGLLHYYNKEFQEAISYFKAVLKIYAHDKASQIYLERCQHWQQVGIADDWEGIEILDSK